MSGVKDAADQVNDQMAELESAKKDEQKKNKKVVRLVIHYVYDYLV